MTSGGGELVGSLRAREAPHGEPSSSSAHATKRRRAHGAAALAMADRFFPNDLPDFVAEAPDYDSDPPAAGLRGLLSLPYPRLSDRLLGSALRLKEKVVEETWTRAQGQVTDYTLYTGTLGTAVLLFKSFAVTGDRRDLALAGDIVQACDAASRGLPRWFLTSICGKAGVCALGAVIMKHCNDQLLITHYLSSFDEITVAEKVPNELLYGRAGYLWACLFLNEHLSKKTIPLEHIHSVAKDIIREGRELSKKGSCPLMYEWHGKKYWGAAHGLAGIMHVLMHTELKLDEQDDVKNTLRYMISNRFPSGNYRSSEGSESDRLVHWCQGAPGFVLTLAKAYELFCDDQFKQLAAEAAEVVWNRGLLKRVRICHGISGNAYAFLSLYRLTGNVEYL